VKISAGVLRDRPPRAPRNGYAGEAAGLSPAVQDREQAGLSAEMPGIAATSSSVSALAWNKQREEPPLFLHISGTSAWAR